MLIDDVILTPRQEQVLRGVAARKTLKEIAGDLGISESRVNDHVRKLKSLFAANSLSQLAQVQADRDGADAPYRFSAPPNSRLVSGAGFADNLGQDEAGQYPTLSLHDAGPIWSAPPPWAGLDQPRVVPGALDGTDFRWARAKAMVVMMLGFFVSVVVAVAAFQALAALYE